jgi:hypothetical protein
LNFSFFPALFSFISLLLYYLSDPPVVYLLFSVYSCSAVESIYTLLQDA